MNYFNLGYHFALHFEIGFLERNTAEHALLYLKPLIVSLSVKDKKILIISKSYCLSTEN